MADIFSKEKRSNIMSRIQGKNTKPEMIVRSLLHTMGYRFRKNYKKLPGTPDICLPKFKTVIFVHGCFWHRHENCSRTTMPKSNYLFWQKKFADTQSRDEKVESKLKDLGWKVVTIWQCETTDKDRLKRILSQVLIR